MLGFESRDQLLQHALLMKVGFLFLSRARLFQVRIDLVDSIGEDFQIGESDLFAEAAEFVGQVSARISIEHDDQSIRFAQDTEPARVVAPLGCVEPRRIEKSDLGGGRLFRVEHRRELVEPRVRQMSDAGLPLLDARGIGLDAGQPLENRALART